ncbi:MAG TPA: SusC/RagA family TonB-linked outer membrane protein [Sphingobacterium sp.]|nr:SusC/RagA family TonB-linked outer membrane protein [Sphingobacterium sp.]
MKLTTLLLVISMGTCYSSISYSQSTRISVDFKGETIKQVLSEIEKKSEYVFFYLDDVLDVNRKVTVSAKNETVENILKQVLNPKTNSYLVSDRQIYILKKNHQNTSVKTKKQQREIKGKVTDENGEPVVNANVVEKGTTNGTVTDEEGLFTLEDCDNNSVLQVSFIGYKTLEILVGDLGFIEVELESESILDEVVVVGMNIRQTKRSLTGAMSQIETKELKQSPVANLNNALAGRLPGLISVQSTGEPGNDQSNLYIRGIGTYGSNTAPLIVVDGLPRGQGSFSQIDPNEVESVSILKDASSSALYGIQGANGVIVVTTKRGSANQKTAIDFTGQFSSARPIRLPEYMDLYNSALYYNENDTNMGLSPRFNESALQSIREGTEPYLYPDVNWLDEILRDQANQSQYNVNISGSSDHVRYFASGSYLNQGTLLNHGDVFKANYGLSPKFDRYNFRSNIDINATKRLDVQIDLAGRLEQRAGPSSGFGHVFSAISLLPRFAMPLFNPDGSLARFIHEYENRTSFSGLVFFSG